MGLKNEPHLLYYVIPPADQGKFNCDPSPDLPKIMTSYPLPLKDILSLLGILFF